MRTERFSPCPLFVICDALLTFIAIPEVQPVVPIAIRIFLRQIRDFLLTKVAREISSIDALLPLITCLCQSMLSRLNPAFEERIYCHCLLCKATLRSHEQFFIRLFCKKHSPSRIIHLTTASNLPRVTRDFCSKVEVVVIQIHTPMNDQPRAINFAVLSILILTCHCRELKPSTENCKLNVTGS